MAAQTDIEQWAKSVRATLAELSRQDFGYPLGCNEIRDKSFYRTPPHPSLKPLYEFFDGISLPDVHVGYFIDPVHRIVSASERGEPTLIKGKSPRAIHVFESDGGGGRFALATEDGAIYYLPSSGAVREGIYFENETAPALRIAENITAFLDLLKADIEAFTRGDQDHRYIAR